MGAGRSTLRPYQFPWLLPLHRAECQPAHDEPLNQQRQHHRQRDRDDHARGDKVKHNLEHSYADQAEQVFYNQLAHELLQENQFEIPEKMVSDYLDRIVEDMKKSDKSIDEAAVRENYKADATFNMKWFYFKSKIAEVEDIKVEDNDIDDYLKDTSRAISELRDMLDKYNSRTIESGLKKWVDILSGEAERVDQATADLA